MENTSFEIFINSSCIFHDIDPNSRTFRIHLKNWVRVHIPKEGDHIYRGKKDPEEDDWLLQELKSWKEKEEHDFKSNTEIEELWEREGDC